MRYATRHARPRRRAARWGSSVAVLSAALLALGLSSPAVSAGAAPDDLPNVEETAADGPALATGQGSADPAQSVDPEPAPSVPEDQSAASEPDQPAASEPDQPAVAPAPAEDTGEQDATGDGPGRSAAPAAAAEPEATADDPQAAPSATSTAAAPASDAPAEGDSSAAAEPTEPSEPSATSGTGWCNAQSGSSSDFQQWSHTKGPWTSGNPGAGYTEGDWVRQRVQLTGLAAGNNQFVVSFGVQKKRAIGYDDARLVQIADSNHTTFPGATGTVRLSGTTPDAAGGTQEGTATFNFTLPAAGTVWLYYDLHLASSLDYQEVGLQGAASYPGASLYARRVSLNCVGLGAATLSISAAPLALGTLTVDKVTEPAGATDLFGFTVTDGPRTSPFQLADSTAPWTSQVSTGTLVVTEEDSPEPWSLTDLVCTGADTVTYDLAAAQAVLTVAAGQHATCTFTSSRSASLTVQKTWVDALAGDQGTLAVGHSSHQDSVTSTANGDDGSWTDAEQLVTEVLVGTQVTISEALATSNTGDYEQSITCDGARLGEDNAFTMPDGPVTCTVTNDRLVPHIDVIKQAWDVHGEEITAGSQVRSGTLLHWTYEVTNTGETALDHIAVTDDQVTSVHCPSTALDPGRSMTCTASGQVEALEPST